MFNPNKIFQQQQNQAQQKQFQNASNRANKLQQKQFQNTINQWNQKSRDQARKNMQIQSQYQLAGENARRIGPRSAQTGAERPSSWKKNVGIMILIAGVLLTLGAVLQAHSSSGTQAGTPGVNSNSGTSAGTTGVIITGANIRTGPGTENSIAAIAPAGTRIVIRCTIATSEGYWDELTSPYRGLYVGATLVQSDRPARC
jgi:hypothetical protein